MNKTMGIIGFGRFGRLAALHLKDHFDLVVYDTADCKDAAETLGVRAGQLEEVGGCPYVLLCVPISRLQPVLMELAPHLVERALVVDTCSVKEYPVSLMTAILPTYVDILGTHPLFGPDSAAKGLKGKKIVLCPIRTKDVDRVTIFLKRLKLHVLVCSPEAHDRGMASTQAIVQFLGRAFLEMGLTEDVVATPGYDQLIGILEVVQNDTPELFHDLQSFNRFASGMRQRLIESLMKVNQKLEDKTPWALQGEAKESEDESRISGRTRRI